MTKLRTARVFPRLTAATPDDPLAFVGVGPGLFPPECDEVHVSVAFTWDLPAAERLAREWERLGVPVHLGGPATGARGDEFVPGRYLKRGYVVTSRGCPNRCWFCSVPKREGGLRELPVTDGFNVLDDNLLACSEAHVRSVFAMLARQPERPRFTGGLEAARMVDWHVHELAKLKPERVFFAYDTPDDWEPLVAAARKMLAAGFTAAGHRVRSYVLIGFPGDSMGAADARLRAVCGLGITPFAMLWRDDGGRRDPEWAKFARQWARPELIYTKALS